MITKVNLNNLSWGFYARNFVYKVFKIINGILGTKPTISVLCYHSIATDNWRFSTPLSEFQKQMDYLVINGYAFISAKDLLNYIEGTKEIKKPSVLITFDDGYSNICNISKVLKKYDIRPLVFLLSPNKKINTQELGTNIKLLNKSQVTQLINNGWDIGSHSSSHPDFSKLSNREAFEEILVAKRELEDVYKIKVNYFAYPKGTYNQITLGMVKKSKYLIGFSVDDGLRFTKKNRYNIPRVGVDGSHSISEFSSIMLPASVIMRKILRMTPLAKII